MIINKVFIQAEEKPENIAFSDTNNKVTYKELENTVLRNTDFLLQFVETNANKPIVVFIDRNIESLITFFSIAMTGNFYVPIDISQPMQRVMMIIDTLNPVLAINTTSKVFEDLNEEKLKTIDYSVMAAHQHYDKPKIESIIDRIIDTDPLYAKFTSGSTGVPKGVVVSHRSVKDLVTQFNREFKFSSKDVFGNQAPFDFDVSVKDIYNSLNVGAEVVIIPRVNFTFPAKLISFLNERKVTVGIWAVSVLRIVENFKGLDKDLPLYLNKIMFSGEVMPNKILNYWREKLPNTQFVNLYGPTEITCNCTFYTVDREFDNEDPLPIGIPFNNTRIILLDKDDNYVNKVGGLGEICVVGSSLSLGYYNNHEVTDEVFVLNPNNKMYDEKIYRTGDIGYYAEDGLLMFSSRKDSQIKHMGHRIELGEIEISVNSLESIDSSFCIYDKEDEKIVLFYQSAEANNKEIYRSLSSIIPKYMIPTRMFHHDKLPINNNAKIDRVLITKEYYDQKN